MCFVDSKLVACVETKVHMLKSRDSERFSCCISVLWCLRCNVPWFANRHPPRSPRTKKRDRRPARARRARQACVRFFICSCLLPDPGLGGKRAGQLQNGVGRIRPEAAMPSICRNAGRCAQGMRYTHNNAPPFAI